MKVSAQKSRTTQSHHLVFRLSPHGSCGGCQFLKVSILPSRREGHVLVALQ